MGFISLAYIEALGRIPNIEIVAISDIDEMQQKQRLLIWV